MLSCIRSKNVASPIIKAFIVFVATARLHATSKAAGSFQGRIVGGQQASPAQFPWQLMLYKSVNNGRHYATCGAVLIDKNYALTAAHCLEESDAERISGVIVGFGEHDLGNPTRNRILRNATYLNHEDYNNVTLYADISLLRFDDLHFTDYIQPISLPPSSGAVDEGHRCTVSGWGETQAADEISLAILRYAVVEYIPLDVCNEWYSEINLLVTDEHVCAGYEAGQIDACAGDSGGPLVCPSSANSSQNLLEGITSYGYLCAARRRPGAYTNVRKYIDWIWQNTNMSVATAVPATTTPSIATMSSQVTTSSTTMSSTTVKPTTSTTTPISILLTTATDTISYTTPAHATSSTTATLATTSLSTAVPITVTLQKTTSTSTLSTTSTSSVASTTSSRTTTTRATTSTSPPDTYDFTLVSFTLTLRMTCDLRILNDSTVEYRRMVDTFHELLIVLGNAAQIPVSDVTNLQFRCGSVVGSGLARLLTGGRAIPSREIEKKLMEEIGSTQHPDVVGLNISDVNECEASNTCHAAAICMNKDPGFICQCRDEYRDKDPANPGTSCEDQCLLDGARYCLNDGTCAKQPGNGDPICYCPTFYIPARCSNLDMDVIIGVGIGGAMVLAFFITLVVCCLRRAMNSTPQVPPSGVKRSHHDEFLQ